MRLILCNNNRNILNGTRCSCCAGRQLTDGSFIYNRNQLAIDYSNIRPTAVVCFCINLYVITRQVFHAVSYWLAAIVVV